MSNSKKFVPHIVKLEEGIYFELDCAYIKGEKPIVNFGLIITLRDVSKFMEYDNLRREFVTAVSHELRTPITSINLSIQNLKKYHTQLSVDQRNDLLDMTAKSSSLLNQMVEDLLILSRIEAREFKLELIEFNLHKIISTVLKRLEPRKKAKLISIEVDVSSDIILHGDPRRIGQVIEIFVDTSLKECEKRDVKGLYRKARAGEIKEFTGISDPYENPENPEIIIKTGKMNVEESVEKIIKYFHSCCNFY